MSPTGQPDALRVAFVAGTLGQGGAEKQCVFMVRALRDMGAQVRIFSLTRGEHYESALAELGLRPTWIGQRRAPPIRLARLILALRGWSPHFVQSSHFFTNLYATVAARVHGAIGIGAIRNDVEQELATTGVWGPRLLCGPKALIANSEMARSNAFRHGVEAETVQILPNVIDVEDFDRRASAQLDRPLNAVGPIVIAVANPRPAKRLERFVRAVAAARREIPDLVGIVVGHGPGSEALRIEAQTQLLPAHALQLLGRRNDVPAILSRATVMLVTSDHEGLPNVILEAMAASRPIVTTRAGDAGRIVLEADAGHVVDFDAIDDMATSIVDLVRNPGRRAALGANGRRAVEERYSHCTLGQRLLTIYDGIARNLANDRLPAILQAMRR